MYPSAVSFLVQHLWVLSFVVDLGDILWPCPTPWGWRSFDLTVDTPAQRGWRCALGLAEGPALSVGGQTDSRPLCVCCVDCQALSAWGTFQESKRLSFFPLRDKIFHVPVWVVEENANVVYLTVAFSMKETCALEFSSPGHWLHVNWCVRRHSWKTAFRSKIWYLWNWYFADRLCTYICTDHFFSYMDKCLWFGRGR